MASADLPGLPRERHTRWRAICLAVLLGANFGLIAYLLTSQTRLQRRLATLEAAADVRNRHIVTAVSGEGATTAGRAERIALILAAATDPDATRRLLAAMPLAECVEIARTLASSPPGNERNAALRSLLRRIAEDTPASALAVLDRVGEPALRGTLAGEVSAVWIDHDPAGAAGWLVGDGPSSPLPPGAAHRNLEAALMRWAEFDPAAATRFAATRLPADDGNKLILRRVAREWARQDPTAALQWTSTLAPGDPRRAIATDGMIDGWADVNPAQAATYAGQLTGETGARFAEAVAARWAGSDPAAAARWAGGLSDPAARQDAVWQVALRWAQNNSAAAANWAETLPAGPGRLEVWQMISDHLAETDATAAETWLGTLPANDRDRDAAVVAYAARIVRTDPEKSLTWARTLAPGPYSDRQIQTLLDAWASKDAVAARDWAAANQLGARK